MSFYLSKSKYCSAVQCPKMLWLKKHKPEEFDASVMQESVLETGNQVGDLAMGLFGDFTEVPFGDLGEMLRITGELMEQGAPIIAEASFSFDGLFCSVDILKNLGNNHVELYEVKSSTEVKEIYREDVAYQRYVLEKLGYIVDKACLVFVNKYYVRQGELDIQQLFRREDLTEDSLSRQGGVCERVEKLKTYMAQTEEPADDIGEHCFAPYDCGFFPYCTRHLPKPNVFDVARLRSSTKIKNYRKGLISFEDLQHTDKLNARQYMQIEHELYHYPPHVRKEHIRAFLDMLSYPIYFLDFESFQPAIPLYDNSKPYEQIVFQYSLHWIEEKGGPLKHTEFLACPGQDPRRALAEQLCRDIPMDVCTTVYNMSFEKTRIRGLAELYPDLQEHLMNIHDHIQDLMFPFQQSDYYCYAMEGSYSIKHVLPALFPDDPALNYDSLEGVHNGTEASNAFAAMDKMPPEEVEITRERLLKYCGLDTFAMVKVWEKLHRAADVPLTVTW